MAVKFSGSHQGINCGSADSLDNLDPMSITAWIRPAGWGQTSYGRIADKWNGGTYGWSFYVSDDYPYGVQALGFGRFRSTGFAQAFSDENTISLDIWQHVAVTYDEGEIKFYIDGIEPAYLSNSAGSGTLKTDGGSDFRIGNHSSYGRDYDGDIDDIRVYNSVLSPSEVQSIHAMRGHDGAVEDLVSRWVMNEGAPGTAVATIRDIGDYKNNGTASAGVGDIDYEESILAFRRRV